MKDGFIKISGENFTRNGKKIVLKGFGVGSWMNLEHFMIGLPGTDHQIKQAFTEIYGAENAESFFDSFLLNFLDENDFKFFNSLGVNVLRLPVNYHYFIDDQHPDGFLEQGFKYLDHVISLCQKYGIYAIIDLHTAPGGQNPDWHCDTSSGLSLFWEYAALRKSFTRMWQFIAEHYKDNVWVAGYDLLNEPAFVPDATVFNEFYDQTVAAIRRVDREHIIFLEGNAYAKDFQFLNETKDPQVAYSFHYYPTVDEPALFEKSYPVAQRKQFLRDNFQALIQIREKYHRPLWCGELGLVLSQDNILFSRELIQEMLNLCEEYDISWTLWAYKDAQCMGIVFPKDETPWMNLVKGIKQKWNQSQEMSMAETALDYLSRKYMQPIGKDLMYPLQFRIRTLFHTICVEEYLMPALRNTPAEQLPELAGSFSFDHCACWEEMAALVRQYTKS